MVELSHGFLRSSSAYANVGMKVEFSAWLTERKTRKVCSDFIFSLFSKAESSDKKKKKKKKKNLTDIFMKQLG